MYRFARYRWYRRLVGGLWLHSMSCGWFPVTDSQLQEYLREMPRYITGIEDNTHDDAVLHGVLISVAIVCVVISAGLVTGAIPS